MSGSRVFTQKRASIHKKFVSNVKIAALHQKGKNSLEIHLASLEDRAKLVQEKRNAARKKLARRLGKRKASFNGILVQSRVESVLLDTQVVPVEKKRMEQESEKKTTGAQVQQTPQAEQKIEPQLLQQQTSPISQQQQQQPTSQLQQQQQQQQPLTQPTTQLTVVKTGMKFSSYDHLRLCIANKLASVDTESLFKKLDIDGSNGLSQKEFVRLLASVDRKNTTKESIRAAWRAAIKNGLGKPELEINDLVEWIRACGEWAKNINV